MSQKAEETPHIDDAVVQRYWEGSGNDAAAMSMMAHEHNLPPRSAAYRLKVENETMRDWLDSIPASAAVLDVGCGAGSWVERLAQRYGSVIGVERSSPMVEAARERVEHLSNAQILKGVFGQTCRRGNSTLYSLVGCACT